MLSSEPSYLKASSFYKLSKELLPEVSRLAIDAFSELAEAGFARLFCVEGYRSPDHQNILYGQGRTVKQLASVGVNPVYSRPELPVVTTLHGKLGKHSKRIALDINISYYPKSAWTAIAFAFVKRGFTWGGSWRIKDYCHFEFNG